MNIDNNKTTMPTPSWQVTAFYMSSMMAYIVNTMFSYSLVIYTRHITESDSLTGLVFLMLFGPFAIFSLVGGITADRYSRKGIILMASALAAVFVGIMALVIDKGFVTPSNFWLLGVFAVGFGIIVPFMATARIAMVGNILTPQRLGSGTIIMSIMAVVGYGLGPLVAGLIKDSFSWSWLFGFNALGWVISGLGFLLVTRMHPQQKSVEASHFDDFKEGLSYIYNHKLLLQICVFMMVMATFVLGPYQTVMPEFLKQTFELGEKQRGAFMAIFGAGLLLGGIGSTGLRTHAKRGLILIVCTLFVGATLALVSVSSAYYPSMTFLFVSGCLGGVCNGLVSAIMQEESPDRVRGRVMSMYTFIIIGVPAMGGLLFSVLAEVTSLSQSIIYAGVSGVIFSMVFGKMSKQLRVSTLPQMPSSIASDAIRS